MLRTLRLVLIFALTSSAIGGHAESGENARTQGDIESFEAWFWGQLATFGGKKEIAAPIHISFIADTDDALPAEGRSRPSQCSFLPDDVGVFASRDLEEDEILFKVPYNLLLTSDRILGASILGELLTTDENDASSTKIFVEPEDVLAIYAVLLRYSDEESPLQPWVDMWPEHVESPLYWEQADMEKFMRGTNLFESANSSLSAEQERFELLAGSIFTTDAFGLDVTFDMWRWAVTIVQSRKVDFLDAEGNPFPAIVPMMDMFNHRVAGKIMSEAGKEVENSAGQAKNPNRPTFGYNTKHRFAFVQANQFYAAGEQVFLHYGRFSTRELLEWFGFVLPVVNPHDTVQVPVSYLALDPSDPTHELLGPIRDELLNSYRDPSLGNADLVFMTRNGVSEELLAAAQIINTAEADFNINKDEGPMGPRKSGELSPESIQNVQQWFQYLTASMLHRLPDGADLREQYKIASSPEEFRALTHAQQLMLQYTITEKEVIWSIFHAFVDAEKKLLAEHGIEPTQTRDEL